jgi:hypothetical protein
MTEKEALHDRRALLLQKIADNADEIARIDLRLNHMMDGIDPDNIEARP